MSEGYLFIETSRSHPGVIRLFAGNEGDLQSFLPRPNAGESDPAIRHVARFSDMETARMHAHSRLRRRLVDIDRDLYQVAVEDAVAAVESLDLTHERVYLDPSIEHAYGRKIDEMETAYAKKHRLQNRLWLGVGWIALIWLTILTFGGSLRN